MFNSILLIRSGIRLALMALVLGPLCASAQDLGLTPEETAWLKGHPVIRVAADPDFLPAEYRQDDGKYVGVSDEYLALAEKALGVKFVRGEKANWAQTYAAFVRGEYEMCAAMIRTPERQRRFLYTRPYMTTSYVAISPREGPPVAVVHDLAGRRVAVVGGYATAEFLRHEAPTVRLVEVDTNEKGVALVKSGEADVFVGTLIYLPRLLAQGLPGLNITTLTDYADDIGMAVARTAAPLAGALDKVIASVSAQDRAAFIRKWTPNSPVTRLDYRVAAFVLAGAVLLVAALLAWVAWLRREIARRRRAEERAKDLLAAIGESSGGVALTDAQGRATFVNRACLEMFRATPASFAPRLARVFAGGEGVRAQSPELAEAIARGHPWSGHVKSRRDDGEPFDEELSMTPLHGVDGTLSGYVIQCQDVTERERLREQVISCARMESVERLAGGVAHDFNNMLQAILGSAELGLTEDGLTPALKEELEAILQAARRSADLTRQLLVFSRRSGLAPVRLNLVSAVDQMAEIIRRLLGPGITLDWRPPEVRRCAMVALAEFDAVLSTLCANARDAIGGAAGGVVGISLYSLHTDGPLALNTGALPSGDYQVLAVRDNGCGMDAKTVERIFEPFFTTRPRGKGAGLGLATAYGIVMRVHGGIRVTSAPGEGSTFEVFLPAVAAAPIALAPAAKASPGGGTAAGVILLVDDEPLALQATRFALQSLGHTVLAFDHPEAAFAAAKDPARRIDLLVSDVVMPGMNGPELYRAIRVLRPDLRVLFVSGYTANLLDDRIGGNLAADFLAKPFTREELAAAVAARLGA